MKVIELRAENFKKLKAVQIKPDPTIQVISGANGAGKSSVLDAIWSALAGSEMSKETGTTEPIRQGEEKAVVRLDLGEFVVTRKWSKSGSIVTVENKDGATYKSPQALLDGLVGKISLDPLAFAAAPEKSQRETLLSIVNIPLDLEKNTAYRESSYTARTYINREIKSLQSRIDAIPVTGAATEVSTAGIIEEQRAAVEVIRKNNAARALVSRMSDDVSTLKKSIENSEIEVERLKEKLKSSSDLLTLKNTELEAKERVLNEETINVVALVDPDLNTFTDRLKAAETINRNARLAQDRKNLELERTEKERAVEKLTQDMDELDKARNDAIAAAAFPVPGLGFNASGVTFGGVPFAQCSSAEKLRVSVAVAMAASPKLRVIRITDGSLIDSKNMEILTAMAKENDYQLWIERVDESGKVGIYIEDGQIKA